MAGGGIIGSLMIGGAIFFVLIAAVVVLIKGHRRRVREVEEGTAPGQATASQAPAPPPAALLSCPACGKQVSNYATACPSCGHPLQPATQVQAATQRTWSPGIAALLSFVIPGAGQMYKGHVGAGLLWFVFVVGGYFLFIIPGLLLHVACIFLAATRD